MLHKALAIVAFASASVSAHAAEPRPASPIGNPGTWVTDDDYPPGALREDAAGRAVFAIKVSPQGLPVGCTISASTGNAELDEATCRLITERARFSPARDSRGRAVEGTYNGSIRWQIPDASRAVPETGSMTLKYVVEVDGSVTNCRTEPAPVAIRGDNLCAMITERRFDPPLDDAGAPSRRAITQRWTVVNEPADK